MRIRHATALAAIVAGLAGCGARREGIRSPTALPAATDATTTGERRVLLDQMRRMAEEDAKPRRRRIEAKPNSGIEAQGEPGTGR